jgi:NADH dehydrogenase/NADH:ubiquinone oxidoreductase subunit G
MLSGITECTYLAGKLSQFEYPHLLFVEDFADKKAIIPNNDFVFPFLMTQAPVKPIITPVQIREYVKALRQLESADVLFVLGYSLCENDNHINAMLREFLIKGKKIVYFAYDQENKKDIVDVKAEVRRNLRVDSERHKDLGENQITVIIHNGEKPSDILNRGWDSVKI